MGRSLRRRPAEMVPLVQSVSHWHLNPSDTRHRFSAFAVGPCLQRQNLDIQLHTKQPHADREISVELKVLMSSPRQHPNLPGGTKSSFAEPTTHAFLLKIICVASAVSAFSVTKNPSLGMSIPENKFSPEPRKTGP